MTRYARRLIVLSWCAVIFWESSQSEFGEPPAFLRWVPMPDKIAHIAIYGVLAAAVFFACLKENMQWLREHPYLASIVFVAFYGASDELHQLYVPKRTSDPLDLAADVVGAILFAGAIYMFHALRDGRNDSKHLSSEMIAKEIQS